MYSRPYVTIRYPNLKTAMFHEADRRKDKLSCSFYLRNPLDVTATKAVYKEWRDGQHGGVARQGMHLILYYSCVTGSKFALWQTHSCRQTKMMNVGHSRVNQQTISIHLWHKSSKLVYLLSCDGRGLLAILCC